MAYLKSICDRWRSVRAVYYDHTGTKGMDEQIDRAGFPGIKGVDFTKPLKHGMALSLKQLMMTPRDTDKALPAEQARRKFELPFDQDVQAELNIEQWEQSHLAAKSTRLATLKALMMTVSGRFAWQFSRARNHRLLEKAHLCCRTGSNLEKNRIGLNLADYTCPNCHTVHATCFTISRPIMRCRRCHREFSLTQRSQR